MKKDKIYELRIDEDDEISGIDSISLVSEPAIEINWVAFNKVKSEDFHIPDGEDDKYIQKLISTAQNEQELFDEGWVVDSVEILDGKNSFVSTNPNGPSIEDEQEYNVRYKYILNPRITGQGPIINTTRDFCKTLINRNYVWRVEDMEATQNDFGQSAMVWRGGWNCRHVWSRIKYRKDATITNKASVNKGKVEVNGFPNDLVPDPRVLGYAEPDTVTNKTLGNPSPSTIKNLGLSKEKFELPLFPTKEEAEKLAPLLYGCSGSHPHVMDGKTYYMPCEKHPEDLGYDNVLPPFVDEGVEWDSRKLEQIRKEQNMSKQMFQTDDEKKIVVGPAMVPDLKIFRRDKNGDPYYVTFKEDTIKMIMEKYMRNKYIDNNDTEHNGKAAEDVYVIESWIKEDENDKSNKYGFENLPVGTWFVSMKVRNDDVWKRIKSKELNGFSVSGFFEEIEAFYKEQEFLSRVAELLKNIKD